MDYKILVVGPSWVGDMVMAQSLFKQLKSSRPDASIDVLAPLWSQSLLARMPEVSESIVMSIGHGKLNLVERYALGKKLRQNNYNQAIVLPNSFKSALIPFFANIPLRTGWRGEMRWLILNDVRHLDKDRYPLEAQRYAALAVLADENKELIRPSLFFSTDTQNAVLKKLELSRPTKPVLAICPGAEYGPAKRWPEEYYATIAASKLAEGWDVWILGSAKDSAVTEKILQQTGQRCVNLTGNTSLLDAIDLLSLADAVVSNDSGLMHVAAAVQKPVIALYGPTSPNYTPPLHERAVILKKDLPCQPCHQRECPLKHHRCMRELAPAIVLKAISESA
jgi:heptosyltransferase-2